MTSERGPLVSIGMPLFNAERTLSVTVRSLFHQAHENWELFLIDDGSPDGTVGIARSFADNRIRVVEGGVNLGLPSRLNQAVSLAGGTFFARMDQDDVAYPERLARQVEYLVSHPDVHVLGTSVMVFGSEGRPIGVRHAPGCSHTEICAHPCSGFPLAHPTWLGRTSWFRAHPYTADAIMCEDQDLLLRTHSESRFASLAEILLGYREERISIRKLLRTRCCFSRALVREALRRRSPAYLMGVPQQMLKAAIDMAAITSGLNYRLLRHRARPATEDELRGWAQVWAQCGRVNEVASQ
jgi:glycosyltransferase involved in cell wall biosynthesis